MEPNIIPTTSEILVNSRTDIPTIQGWNKNSEVQLAESMHDQMLQLYQLAFPNSVISYTSSSSDAYKNVYDVRMGMDVVVTNPQWGTVTVQEKVRDPKYLSVNYHESRDKCPDYCLEWTSSLSHEQSEAFNCIATYTMLAFVDGFYEGVAVWALIDNAAVKRKIAKMGIENLGTLHQNSRCGAASFYAMSLYNIADCIVDGNVSIVDGKYSLRRCN